MEALNRSVSDVVARRKNINETCAKQICITSSDTPRSCVSGCDKQIHINHGHGIVQSSSDYLLQRKSNNQYKITTTESSLFTDLDCSNVTSSD